MPPLRRDRKNIFTRRGTDRILRYAFELARTRPRHRLTSATKSNGISITMPYWDERVKAMAAHYPDVRVDQFHIDILSDLGPACTGTIGIAPSANLNPTRAWPSLFEPVHGSAPDIAGRGIANPIGQIWSCALLLDFLGRRDAHDAVLRAIEQVLDPAHGGPRTPDLGGNARTEDLGRAVAAML